MTARRSVDWSKLLGPEAPEPVLMAKSACDETASLLAAFDMLLTTDQIDLIWRRAIELARSRIGLVRAGIFVLDERAGRMFGTWGTNLEGEIQDEHHVMFDVNEGVLDVFRRAERGEQYFTALDNCPIVVQRADITEVVGRGWVACTPIRSADRRFGILFNDTGTSGAPLDEDKQTRAALLCSLLGKVIELARAQPRPAPAVPQATARHPLVQKAVELLAHDPALAGKEIAAKLDTSVGRLLRLFKSELGLSLVEYRNRLRLDRFQVLVEAGEQNLHDVARTAGFGSYAQFHRVFRGVYAAAPRDYLRAR